MRGREWLVVNMLVSEHLVKVIRAVQVSTQRLSKLCSRLNLNLRAMKFRWDDDNKSCQFVGYSICELHPSVKEYEKSAQDPPESLHGSN